MFGDRGRDIFVFASGEGADIIFDFELGRDAIAKLAEGIALTTSYSYDSLDFEYYAAGNYTTIRDSNGELITTLIGIEASELNPSDFTTV